MSREANLLLLSTINADKGKVDNLDQRLEMMKTFNKMYKTTDKQLFIDKAMELKSEFDRDLVFIMGYDTLKRFFDKKYYVNKDEAMNKFFSMAEIWYYPRGGNQNEIDQDLNKYQQFIRKKSDINMEHCSSTRVRQLLQESPLDFKLLQELLSKEILDIILENNYYKIQ